MKRPKVRKSDATRQRILEAALALLRRRGFERTTMRDVAAAAGLSLGAAYYYFPSKEAILLAYYARNQSEHEALARTRLADQPDLRARLGLLMHGKLDAVARERKLLGALVRRLADPADPISAFARQTADVRRDSIALFTAALDGAGLPADLQRLAAPALWMLHLALLLYFVNDRSASQSRTRRLVDDALDLAVPLIALGANPATATLRAQLAALLERAALI